MSRLTAIITGADARLRNAPLEQAVAGLSLTDLLAECDALDAFWRSAENLYERVRALFFLYAIHRFHLPPLLKAEGSGEAGLDATGRIGFEGYAHLLERRFVEAIRVFLAEAQTHGRTDALCSALARGYHQLALQLLADQVRLSVRAVRGNQWMFRTGAADEHPLRMRTELLQMKEGLYPVLHERTAVRMDLSHSSWSDIFFLGMDYPEGARVLNVSINLAVLGRDEEPEPPVEAMLRVIDQPVLRLTSVDLGATVEIHNLEEVFDFARDHLGLLKAGLIAAGIVPIGLEGSGEPLTGVLERLLGPGLGLELVTHVNGIPKGSRLAVSTNLLGSLISVCMRATGQTKALTGELEEGDRRMVAARAILGEWMGGSGGGWQDSGGVWPGIKIIEGCAAGEGDPEDGVSRGRLLPKHTVQDATVISDENRRKLEDSLVLVHGGLAQNVGPILEMVTEKYLLRSGAEWEARQESLNMFEQILSALRSGDVKELGSLTTRHFQGPLQAIIPWATNAFTERLIAIMQAEFSEDFWGFWMLGGMSGGGMGLIFAPERKEEASRRLLEVMLAQKKLLQNSLPFAMDPVVYHFAINEAGSFSTLKQGPAALLVPPYYTLVLPSLLRADPRTLGDLRRREIELYDQRTKSESAYQNSVRRVLDNLLPQRAGGVNSNGNELSRLLSRNGFDPKAHEFLRTELQAGRIGLARNQLPTSARVENVRAGDVMEAERDLTAEDRRRGEAALRAGEVGVITLAAGAASRWTAGAGVVKALHPFCQFAGRHRTFLETHLAKTRKTATDYGAAPLHIITTSYLTYGPISNSLEQDDYFGLRESVALSEGRSIGLRFVPMERDLRFLWEETAQQVLDERQNRMRGSVRQALIKWAKSAGEGSDYTDNMPLQCVHPVGHWYEVPNLLLNGTLARLIEQRPQLKTLLLHNVDTLGANLDPALLGWHRRCEDTLSFEVIPRRLEDRGGGLARVNDQLRLVEGLALAHEEDEFHLSYYNTLTCWIDVDKLLQAFGLSRDDLADENRVSTAVREFSQRLPSYITLKDVKKRWGHGQEDVFPVAQFEKIWGDMSSLPEIQTGFAAVSRLRGQQMKDPAQLDGWLRDGSRDYVDSLCHWS